MTAPPRLITSAAEIGAARWNTLANPQGLAEPHPFTSYEFFAALEESGGVRRMPVGSVLERAASVLVLRFRGLRGCISA